MISSAYQNIFSLLDGKLQRRFAWSVVLASISGLLELVSLGLFYAVFRFGVGGGEGGEGRWLEYLSSLFGADPVSALVLAALLTLGVKAIFSIVSSRYLYKTSIASRQHLQSLLFKRWIGSEQFAADNEGAAIWIRRVLTDLNIVEGRFFLSILVVMSEALPIVMVCIALVLIDPIMFSAALFILSSAGVLVFYLTHKDVARYGSEQLVVEKSVVELLQSVYGGRKEIRLYSVEPPIAGVFEQLVRKLGKVSLSNSVASLLPRFFLEISVVGALAGMFLLGALFGKSTLDVLVHAALLATAGFRLMPSANKVVVHFQACKYSLAAIESTLSVVRDIHRPSSVRPVAGGERQRVDAVGVKSLSHSFHGNRIFSNLTSVFVRGDFVGIVGPSGSGKSTFLNIVLGFVKPEAGVVIVNNKPVDESDSGWTGGIGYVPQEPYLSDDTMLNNALFGLDSRVENCRKAADLLSQLGFDASKVSSSATLGFGGARLSGGERQRVAIARSLLRDPDLLILDEATSALDVQTQDMVMRIISERMKGRIVLMITHRAETLDYCNKILTLPEGRLAHTARNHA